MIEYCSKRLPGLRLLYLFGSQASGDARPDSDWDIAFLADSDLDNVSRWHIAEELAAELSVRWLGPVGQRRLCRQRSRDKDRQRDEEGAEHGVRHL